MDSFEQDSDAFLDWFRRAEGSRVSDKIRIADLRTQGAGRAVVATQDIGPEEELFSLKKSLVLTPQTSDITKKHHISLPESDPWLPLIVTIIFELLRGNGSPWWPYLRLLPAQFNTLMFWCEEELACLKGSEVVNKIGKKQAEDAWRETIIPIMLEHPSLFPCSGNSEQERATELIGLAHRVGSLIMAYAFDVDKEDSNENDDDDDDSAESSLVSDDDEDDTTFKAMVPFADLLNADADRNNAKLFGEDEHLIMKATASIKAGEEIFNDYGPLPRSDLLRMYGYITSNYAQYDVVELLQTDVTASAQNANKALSTIQKGGLNALDELGLLDDGYVIQRPARSSSALVDVIPAELHMLLRALTCNLGNNVEKQLRKGAKEDCTVEEASLLAAICTKRLTDYTTSIEQDDELLQKLEVSSPPIEPHVSPHRVKMAIYVRRGEKEILHIVLRLCHEQIDRRTSEINAETTGSKRKHDGNNSKSQKQMKKANAKGAR